MNENRTILCGLSVCLLVLGSWKLLSTDDPQGVIEKEEMTEHHEDEVPMVLESPVGSDAREPAHSVEANSRFRVHVLSKGGKPIKGASVELVSPSGKAGDPASSLRVVAGQDGVIEFPTSSWCSGAVLRVSAEGFNATSKVLLEYRESLNVTLYSPRTVSGVVRYRLPAVDAGTLSPDPHDDASDLEPITSRSAWNSEGLPVADAWVLLTESTRAISPEALWASLDANSAASLEPGAFLTKCDSAGSFRFEGVPASKRYFLMAGHGGYASLPDSATVAPARVINPSSKSDVDMDLLIAPLYEAIIIFRDTEGQRLELGSEDEGRLSFSYGTNGEHAGTTFDAGGLSYVLAGGNPGLATGIVDSAFIGFSPLGMERPHSIPDAFVQANVIGYEVLNQQFEFSRVGRSPAIVELALKRNCDAWIDLRVSIKGANNEWLSTGLAEKAFGIVLRGQKGMEYPSKLGIPRTMSLGGEWYLSQVPVGQDASIELEIVSLDTFCTFPPKGYLQTELIDNELRATLDLSNCGRLRIEPVTKEGFAFDGVASLSLEALSGTQIGFGGRLSRVAGEYTLYPVPAGKYRIDLTTPACSELPAEVEIEAGRETAIRLSIH